LVKIGVRGLLSYEPTVVVREYPAKWKKSKEINFDAAELAKLRFDEKWSLKRLAGHCGISRQAILKRLRHRRVAALIRK